jgi:dipeptidyl aminopeptidase/acylaminoacyl peptidase
MRNKNITSWLLSLCAFAAVVPAKSATPTIESFAARARVEGVAISPDGRYVVEIQTRLGRGAVVVFDRRGGTEKRPQTIMGEPEHFRLTWCRWATSVRAVCALEAMVPGATFVYPITRLVGVDADGHNMLVLLQNSLSVQGQFEDRIIDWDPGIKDTVLIEADEGLNAAQQAIVRGGGSVIGNVGSHATPAVFELNVVTGELKLRVRPHEPIRHFRTDNRGEVRLGWGLEGATVSYFARLSGETNWRSLAKFEAFSRERHFDPIAISRDQPNKAYAIGPSEGREALWLIDLNDREEPSLVYSHPAVDVTNPLLAPDGRLLGVYYNTDLPHTYYTEPQLESIIEAVNKRLPEKVYVIRSYSDIEFSHYYVLDLSAGSFTDCGQPYPDLDAADMGRMQPISYPARDGTSIPGYLTVPKGKSPHGLPLIVMPHGGPIARDAWRYFFLQQFLASRGYAVLQMNFRGSSGYGSDWFFAAHQDWGGLTYNDVVDGAKWAVHEGIADPARICTVGWSFGGYISLLAATRDGDLFHCAVSISGLSDLRMLLDEGHHWLNGDVRQKQVGTDTEKLKRDSPRLHAGEVKIPVLLIHGDHDAQAPFEQSEVMDQALTRAGKPHRFVVIKGADHSMSGESDRVTLLNAIEDFLSVSLSSGPKMQ